MISTVITAGSFKYRLTLNNNTSANLQGGMHKARKLGAGYGQQGDSRVGRLTSFRFTIAHHHLTHLDG